MAVLVKVAKPPGGSTGGGSRYLAERELDRERESRETRQLFSGREDNLTPWRADKFLKGEADRLLSDDIHHIIISTLPEEFERLGENDRERVAALREVTREALVRIFAQELEGCESRWVGAVHLHTKLPHAHILLHKEITDPTTGEKKLLKTIPRGWLAARGSTLNDEDPASLGRLSQRFTEALAERSKPFRRIEIRDAAGATVVSREAIDGAAVRDHKPTPEEVLVGRWASAEANAARVGNEAAFSPSSLRGYVQKLDGQSLARGRTKVRAFLTREQISELTRLRSSGLQVTFHTTAPESSEVMERAGRERPDRSLGRDGLERPPLQRDQSLREDQARTARTPKEATAREQQRPEVAGAVDRGAQQARESSHPSPPQAVPDLSNDRSARNGTGQEKTAYPKARSSASRSTEEEAYQKKLKAQQELFESRGRLLIQKFLALSAEPWHFKDFTEAAKKELEAGRQVEALAKSYREKFGEAAPAGVTLSITDKDHLVKTAPTIRHVPGSVRNDFLREVFAVKTSEHVRSYLPRETRPTQRREPTRDTRKGGRGR
jgi:hypothetical protein